MSALTANILCLGRGVDGVGRASRTTTTSHKQQQRRACKINAGRGDERLSRHHSQLPVLRSGVVVGHGGGKFVWLEIV